MSCDRKIGPYDCCSVVQGDCLELMKRLPDGCVDAVITDPPYGIAIARKSNQYGVGFSRDPNKTSICRVATGDSWDDCPPSPAVFAQIFRVSDEQIIFGANHFWESFYSSKCYIVWDKRGSLPAVPFADTEFAWTSFVDRMSKKYTHIKHGFIRDDSEVIEHPCQKPVDLFAEIMRDFTKEGQTILDPFCGSGTTLVAAKKLVRHFLGFEISPEYCAIARDRIARVEAQPSLFEPKAEQVQLFVPADSEAFPVTLSTSAHAEEGDPASSSEEG